MGELPGHKPKPNGIPSNPGLVYRNQGWVNWGDWLGTGTVATYHRVYKPFEEARQFARALRLRNLRQWQAYCRGEMPGQEPKPDDVPADPRYVYKTHGWVGWGDWLGTGTVCTNHRQLLPFAEARAFARALQLQSTADWRRYCKGQLPGYAPKPDNIPVHPNRVYKDCGWAGWRDWRG